MKLRLIAVTVLTASALLGLPTMASATTHHAHVSHVVKTHGPPYCC